ncbi:MAG: hypothetical protein NW224_22720, partial [Leptolyngbyaceae cyanobacterium bins.302]|nr:hypothetical protein [Leptolyngbyaceae cyanobacterium bins.302]
WKPLADYITSGSLIVNLRCKRKQLNQPILRGSYSFSSTFLFPIKSIVEEQYLEQFEANAAKIVRMMQKLADGNKPVKLEIRATATATP